jgi:polysaccharide biosynthesis transport protein
MMPIKNDLMLNPGIISGTPAPVAARHEMTIQDLWKVLSRRKWIALNIFLLVAAAGAILFACSTRLYRATAQIQVQKDAADALDLNNMTGAESQSDAVDANITLQTQAQILQSDSLALKVIEELGLENSPDFRSRFNPVGWVMGLFAPKGIADPKGVPLEQAPGRRAKVTSIFESRLKVKPVAGTRLIGIEYLNPDPKTAAAVVNHLVHDLIEYNYQIRHDATREAGGWLGQQLSDLRKQSEDLQAKVADLQRDSGVFSMGQTDNQGRDQTYTPALDRLQQATSQLEQARSARIMKGALYQVINNGDPELISGLAGSSMMSGASPGVAGSLTLLQTLRSQEAQTQAQLNELSAKFGPGYPRVAEMQASLDVTQRAIRSEAARIAARARNDFAVAQQVEDKDQAVFEDEQAKAQALNDKASEYQIVKQEAKQSRDLYESLLGRLKEADVVAGLRSSNITLVDPARQTSRPAKPNLILYAAASIMGGLFLGVCGALFRDATDNRIQELSEVEMLFSEAPIGLLPYHKMRRGLNRGVEAASSLLSPSALRSPDSMVATSEPRAPYTEALRVLCTTLMQGGNGAGGPKVILVTSSVSGEGKSMLSANLAAVYAQRRKKVLLVDGDLRTPVLHRRLNLDSSQGLSSLLTAENIHDVTRLPVVPIRELPGLHVMPAGPLPSYPAELLASDEMADAMGAWREEYDCIIIDGAPILPVTDSAVLSRYADFTVVVARHNMTDRRSLERTCQILRSQGVHQMGLLLNGVKASGEDHYSYYGYKRGSYYGNQANA